jgi:hypothetical protein
VGRPTGLVDWAMPRCEDPRLRPTVGAVSRLPLAAELFLLSCHEVTGRARIAAARLDLGLGGALLLDLELHGRVALGDGHVVVVDPGPPGDPLLDAALRAVAGDPRPRGPEHWVRHLARGARAAVERRLVASGVLEVDDHRVLGVFPVHHTHPADGRLEHELVERLHAAVVLQRPVDRRTSALASLALAVGLDRCLFPRADRRAVRRRLAEIARDEPVGAAVRHLVDAQDAALGIESGAGGAAP